MGKYLSRLVKVIILSLNLAMVPFVLLAQDGAADGQQQSAETAKSPSKFWSSEDGWLDISGFIDQPYGFVPLVIPITEPAIGYGSALALTFIDKPKGEAGDGFGRPNFTAVGALGTENGTRGIMGGDVRNWLGDRLQTLVGAARASVNLDFHGIGRDVQFADQPLTYNLDISGGVAQAKYRLGDSRVWAGLGYALASVKIGFDESSRSSRLSDVQGKSRVGGITPSVTYDSRDNILTTTRGTYFDVTAGLFSRALGGDSDFQRVDMVGMYFLPINSKLTLGTKGSATLSFGDVPFYARPYVAMRGVPVMRYQGEHVAQVEAELRWQFWKRFSVLAFGGAGAGWNDFERYNKTVSVTAGGVGFRYELARKYGLHMGVDVAVGPDTKAIYVQFGSAWMRP